MMQNKVNKKIGKKVNLKKKATAFIAARRKKQASARLSLLADFLANRLSAAGVSHVVDAPSPLRRTFWVAIILLTVMAMSLMTYRVLQEYLAYPTIMRSKNIGFKELEFPAVTICSLSLIPKIFAADAGLEYLIEMEKVLNSLPVYSISQEIKTRCLKDPMCYWSWFQDRCYCFANPCDTLYCYPDTNKSDEICACSMLLCQWNGTEKACFISHEGKKDGGIACLCRTSFKYPLHRMPKLRPKPPDCSGKGNMSCPGPLRRNDTIPPEEQEAIDALKLSPEISDLLKRLKTSDTEDVRDVERFFIPPIPVVDNYGMVYNSLILSCSYGPESCGDFVTLYSPTYGKCYMFNYIGIHNEKDTKAKIARQAGRDHGLQLYMRARKQDSLPLLTKQLGVRIVVHDPRSLPIATENGIDLRPSDMASLSVEYLEVNRLGSPWGNCAKDGERQAHNYSADPYSQSDCERHCINLEIFRRCGCYHPRYLEATVRPKREVLCHTNSTSFEDTCFIAVVSDSDNGILHCSCPPACREKQYDIMKSASQLNPDFFKLVKKAKSLSTSNGTTFVRSSENETDLMGVQIYFNSFFVTHINETAIYSWESLIANIGGNMGLFLGLSLVTIMEIFEFLTEIISKLISRRCTEPVKPKTTNVRIFFQS